MARNALDKAPDTRVRRAALGRVGPAALDALDTLLPPQWRQAAAPALHLKATLILKAISLGGMGGKTGGILAQVQRRGLDGADWRVVDARWFGTPAGTGRSTWRLDVDRAVESSIAQPWASARPGREEYMRRVVGCASGPLTRVGRGMDALARRYSRAYQRCGRGIPAPRRGTLASRMACHVYDAKASAIDVHDAHVRQRAGRDGAARASTRLPAVDAGATASMSARM